VKRIVCCLALVAGMAGLAVGPALAPAQDKKDVKKEARGTKSATGVIEINEGKDGKFRFVIRDGDGKLLAMSGPTGFATREDAGKAVETLKAVLPGAKVVAGKKGK
jgi:uncharacterized protein YegP (UPF0339 family)